MKKVTKKRVGRTSQGRKGRISRSNNGGNSIVNVPSNKNIIFIVTLIILLLSIVNMFMMITITGAQITETSTVGLCVNNPPTITAIPNQTNAQGALFTYQVVATDNSSLSYSDNTTIFEINNTTGLINFTSNISHFGNHTILITVLETNGSCPFSSTTTFFLEIGNTAPTLDLDVPNQTWEQNVQLTGLNLSDYFSDSDNDFLTYTSIDGGSVTIGISDAIVTFTPETNFAGETWVIFTANDSVSTVDSNNVTLNITGDTLAPSITINGPNGTQLSKALNTTLNVTIGEIGTILYDLDNEGNISLCSLCSNGFILLNFTSFGTHNLTISAIDAVDNVNKSILNFTLVLDTDNDGTSDENDTDDDNDGINDSEDFLTGDTNNVQFNNFDSINISVNNSYNLSQNFNGTVKINITNQSTPLVEFDFNFNSSNVLTLSNITITKQTSSADRGSTIIHGLVLPEGETKTLFVDQVDSSGSVCVEDSQITNIDQISSKCTGSDEYNVPCAGSNSSYDCTDTGTQYKVTGLNNSGGKEIRGGGSSTSVTNGTTTVIGGGGKIFKSVETILKDGECTPSFECTDWNPKSCDGGDLQTRTCTRVTKFCRQITETFQQNCECKPQYQCTIWVPGSCSSDGFQHRACIDTNQCGEKVTLPLVRNCKLSGLDDEGRKAIFGQAIWDGVSKVGVNNKAFFVTFIISTLLILSALILFLFKTKYSEVLETINVDAGENIVLMETIIKINNAGIMVVDEEWIYHKKDNFYQEIMGDEELLTAS